MVKLIRTGRSQNIILATRYTSLLSAITMTHTVRSCELVWYHSHPAYWLSEEDCHTQLTGESGDALLDCGGCQWGTLSENTHLLSPALAVYGDTTHDDLCVSELHPVSGWMFLWWQTPSEKHSIQKKVCGHSFFHSFNHSKERKDSYVRQLQGLILLRTR